MLCQGDCAVPYYAHHFQIIEHAGQSLRSTLTTVELHLLRYATLKFVLFLMALTTTRLAI